MAADELAELVDWAYQGEIVGRARFKTMADLETDAQRREWLQELCELEVRVAAALSPLVRDVGGDPTPRVESTRRGQRMAQRSHHAGWATFLDSLGSITADALSKYRRLLDLVHPGDRALVEKLIAHEEALRDFARLASTEAERPLTPVLEVLADLTSERDVTT